MSHKLEKISEILKDSVNRALSENFDELGLATCIKCSISNDLKSSIAFVSVQNEGKAENIKNKLRKEIGQIIKETAKLRYVPSVKMVFDEEIMENAESIIKRIENGN
ncbi:hypothetical protein COT77_00520 [Candidatus Berkelbacteria bacterium CG10_big_fil_rev_8_21_14_0_10_41_12]|uniref:Ribosome-binding factor A n=1 Tax=Candidatus Berkelbacteria bacterium CG10_big_fil_rev_8_21_14_0_10_41_12 TaxID=1974513 RepID=A0A2M6WXU6_9BACT|nr:MAG: hypothetical protein COT77_00520 [Candidatus Berkelbacteria bacterium CG10_big_fil_rev_8_21_14_0_10_41_12]